MRVSKQGIFSLMILNLKKKNKFLTQHLQKCYESMCKLFTRSNFVENIFQQSLQQKARKHNLVTRINFMSVTLMKIPIQVNQVQPTKQMISNPLNQILQQFYLHFNSLTALKAK
eukprot:TRINITY_DN2930_c0_g1_i15.p5 TRINITY_DN2930_c0_g1~~TRINITY_DN2930_c0_g1_i15.p5  ORF type:complete len:114 (+),score=1.41 TRINITY_DN2930_c0_g1_i15:863-1204(+)